MGLNGAGYSFQLCISEVPPMRPAHKSKTAINSNLSSPHPKELLAEGLGSELTV